MLNDQHGYFVYIYYYSVCFPIIIRVHQTLFYFIIVVAIAWPLLFYFVFGGVGGQPYRNCVSDLDVYTITIPEQWARACK